MEGRKAQGLRAARPFGETVQRSTLYIEHDEAGSIHWLLRGEYCKRKHLASTEHATPLGASIAFFAANLTNAST